jgi:hypothetical protein
VRRSSGIRNLSDGSAYRLSVPHCAAGCESGDLAPGRADCGQLVAPVPGASVRGRTFRHLGLKKGLGVLVPDVIAAHKVPSVKATNLFSVARQQICRSQRTLFKKVHDFFRNPDFRTGDGIASLHVSPKPKVGAPTPRPYRQWTIRGKRAPILGYAP